MRQSIPLKCVSFSLVRFPAADPTATVPVGTKPREVPLRHHCSSVQLSHDWLVPTFFFACADGDAELDSTEEDYTDITDSSVSPRTAAA